MTNKNRSLAYYDSFMGLIPCKVVNIEDDSSIITAIVTTDRPTYKKGEKIICNSFMMVPRSCVHIRSGQYRINPNYAWYIDDTGQINYAIGIVEILTKNLDK